MKGSGWVPCLLESSRLAASARRSGSGGNFSFLSTLVSIKDAHDLSFVTVGLKIAASVHPQVSIIFISYYLGTTFPIIRAFFP